MSLSQRLLVADAHRQIREEGADRVEVGSSDVSGSRNSGQRDKKKTLSVIALRFCVMPPDTATDPFGYQRSKCARFHENVEGYYWSWFENEQLYIQLEIFDHNLSKKSSVKNLRKSDLSKILNGIYDHLDWNWETMIEMSGSETSTVHFYCSDFESYDDLGVPSIWNFCGSLDE
ncbi:unnamed protein product [Brassica oleracea]